MFGGDTKSWEPNPLRPIRESAVKGQLRFWWRTMQHATSAADLRARENAIFGATGLASKVTLAIRHHAGTIKFQSLNVGPQGVTSNGTSLAFPVYALFPLIPRGEDNACIEECQFDLQVSTHGLDAAQRQSVFDAVTLWVLFGGVGARTHRGCGSLYCPEIVSRFRTMEQIKGYLDSLVGDQASDSLPFARLAGARLLYKPDKDGPVKAWNHLLTAYRDFRQLRNPGTKPNRPGRSWWPEPDALRRMSGAAAEGHEPVHPAGSWFPRSAYGMPVQFEFHNAIGDPSGKYFVQPRGKERWTSPVILKSLRLSDSVVMQICLILNQVIPHSLELKGIGGRLLTPSEHPDEYKNKLTLTKEPGTLNESPYDTLVRKLNLTEVR
jgi:CRISPR-associated protein Cmr1